MKVFHKSSCITCKKTIAELERIKSDMETRDFFKEPFSENEIKKILKVSGLTAHEILRKKDKKFKELGMNKWNISESKLIKLMVQNPGLIRRPIILHKNKCYVGKIDAKSLK